MPIDILPQPSATPKGTIRMEQPRNQKPRRPEQSNALDEALRAEAESAKKINEEHRKRLQEIGTSLRSASEPQAGWVKRPESDEATIASIRATLYEQDLHRKTDRRKPFMADAATQAKLRELAAEADEARERAKDLHLIDAMNAAIPSPPHEKTMTRSSLNDMLEFHNARNEEVASPPQSEKQEQPTSVRQRILKALRLKGSSN